MFLFVSVGRVLFERNIAFIYQDSNWKRCKSRDLMYTGNILIIFYCIVSFRTAKSGVDRTLDVADIQIFLCFYEYYTLIISTHVFLF